MRLTAKNVRVLAFIKNSSTWVDTHQIVHHTGVDISAVNRSLRIWTKEGLVVRNEMFQGYLYRLAEDFEQLPLGEKLATALQIFMERDDAIAANSDQPRS